MSGMAAASASSSASVAGRTFFARSADPPPRTFAGLASRMMLRSTAVPRIVRSSEYARACVVGRPAAHSSYQSSTISGVIDLSGTSAKIGRM